MTVQILMRVAHIMQTIVLICGDIVLKCRERALYICKMRNQSVRLAVAVLGTRLTNKMYIKKKKIAVLSTVAKDGTKLWLGAKGWDCLRNKIDSDTD